MPGITKFGREYAYRDIWKTRTRTEIEREIQVLSDRTKTNDGPATEFTDDDRLSILRELLTGQVAESRD